MLRRQRGVACATCPRAIVLPPTWRIGYITVMSLQIAILADSARAAPMLQHARDMLATFGVSVVERVMDDRAAVAASVAALEAGGAAVFIIGDTSADPLSTRVAAATANPEPVVP